MKINSSIQSRWLMLWSLVLTSQLLPNQVWALGRVGISLANVTDLLLRPSSSITKLIGTFAAVLCLDQLRCMLGDRAAARHVTELDTRYMWLEDERCAVGSIPYFDVVIGILSHRAFIWTASTKRDCRCYCPHLFCSGSHQLRQKRSLSTRIPHTDFKIPVF
jgi:hypothetical protein